MANGDRDATGWHIHQALILLGLLLLGWLLRLTVLEYRQLGEDGYLSVGLARLDVDQALAYFLRDIHPPLYYLLLGRWIEWLGPDFLIVRWLSLAGGSVSAALLVSLLRRLFSRDAALVGLTLYTFAPAAILQAATVRDYSLGAVLSLLSWRLLIAPNRSAIALGAIGFATASSLGVWYFHLCTLPLQLLYAWCRRRTALIPLVLGSLVALPWYVTVVLTWIPRWSTERLGAISPFQSDQPAPVVYLAGVGRSLLGDLPFSAGVVLAGLWMFLVVCGLVHLVRQQRSGLAFIVLGGCTLGSLATIAISLSWGGPDFVPRYFLPVLLSGIPALTAVIVATQRTILRFAALLVLVLPGTLFYLNFLTLRGPSNPRALLIRALATRLVASDLVVFDNLEDHGYFWLANRTGARSIAFHTFGIGPWSDTDAKRAAERAAGAPFRAVWWIHHIHNEDPVARAIETHFVASRFMVAGDEVAHWIVKESWLPAPPVEVAGEFTGGVRIVAAQLPTRAELCRTLPVATFWRSHRNASDDLTLFAHVVDHTGRRVAQNDGPPLFGLIPPTDSSGAGPAPDVRWIRFPPNTAPGRYAVQIGLYDDSGNLRLSNGSDRLTVGTVDLSSSCLTAARPAAEPGESQSR